MFMAAVFTIAKTWKQPKCPSTEDLVKKCGTHIQKNEIIPFAAT